MASSRTAASLDRRRHRRFNPRRRRPWRVRGRACMRRARSTSSPKACSRVYTRGAIRGRKLADAVPRRRGNDAPRRPKTRQGRHCEQRRLRTRFRRSGPNSGRRAARPGARPGGHHHDASGRPPCRKRLISSGAPPLRACSDACPENRKASRRSPAGRAGRRGRIAAARASARPAASVARSRQSTKGIMTRSGDSRASTRCRAMRQALPCASHAS